MICHVTATAATQLYITRAESRDLTCRGRKRVGSSGIKWDQVGSSGIKWDQVGSTFIVSVRFEAILKYGVVWCEFLFVVRFFVKGAIWCDKPAVVRYRTNRTKTWSLPSWSPVYKKFWILKNFHTPPRPHPFLYVFLLGREVGFGFQAKPRFQECSRHYSRVLQVR